MMSDKTTKHGRIKKKELSDLQQNWPKNEWCTGCRKIDIQRKEVKYKGLQ